MTLFDALTTLCVCRLFLRRVHQYRHPTEFLKANKIRYGNKYIVKNCHFPTPLARVAAGLERLQGAAFSGGTLHGQSPNDPEVAGVPDVTFAYVHKDESGPYQVILFITRSVFTSLASKTPICFYIHWDDL